MSDKGYIPISRRIFKHRFWCEEREYSRFEAWLDLLQSARFEDAKQYIGKYRSVIVKRGQLVASVRFLADRWKWSTKRVINYLSAIEKDGQISRETSKETGVTVISITNYDVYNKCYGLMETQEETGGKHYGNTTETKLNNINNLFKESNTSNEVSLKKAGDNSSPESPALEISDNQTSALNDEKTSAQNTPPPTPSPEADGQGVPPGADPQSGIAAHIAEQFGKFWDMYGKKTSPKDKCFQKWKKLSAADREAIFRTLPQYVANTPDKRYRKDPATYLNQRVWEFDELPDCRQNGFSKPPEPPKSRIQEAFDTLQRAKQMLRNEQYANNTD